MYYIISAMELSRSISLLRALFGTESLIQYNNIIVWVNEQKMQKHIDRKEYESKVRKQSAIVVEIPNVVNNIICWIHLEDVPLEYKDLVS